MNHENENKGAETPHRGQQLVKLARTKEAKGKFNK
jgi:hypothetical protein